VDWAVAAGFPAAFGDAFKLVHCDGCNTDFVQSHEKTRERSTNPRLTEGCQQRYVITCSGLRVIAERISFTKEDITDQRSRDKDTDILCGVSNRNGMLDMYLKDGCDAAAFVHERPYSPLRSAFIPQCLRGAPFDSILQIPAESKGSRDLKDFADL